MILEVPSLNRICCNQCYGTRATRQPIWKLQGISLENELLSIPSVKGIEWRWLSFRHHWAAAGRIGAQGKFDILRKGLEFGGKCQRYLLDVE
jgi:hypothetical protein